MVLIASGSLRGSITPFGVLELAKKLVNLKPGDVLDLLKLFSDNTRYDRDFCDLVFKRVQA